jgi:hypothetical protein
MTRIPSWLLLIFPGVLVVLSGAAISAQDKYTLQVPGGLAFSEFRGYERWPVIAISENQGVMAVIMGMSLPKTASAGFAAEKRIGS